MTHGANQAPPPFRLCNLNENCSDKNAHTLENKIFGKQFVVAFHRKHAEDPQGTVRRGSGRKSSLRSCPGEAGRGGSVPHSLALVPLLAGVHLPQSSPAHGLQPLLPSPVTQPLHQATGDSPEARTGCLPAPSVYCPQGTSQAHRLSPPREVSREFAQVKNLHVSWGGGGPAVQASLPPPRSGLERN